MGEGAPNLNERKDDSPKPSLIELLEDELRFWDLQIGVIKADIVKNENENEKKQLGRFRYLEKKESLDKQLKKFTKEKNKRKKKIAELKREQGQ